ncbi:hypothetical protein L1987_44588 [Smallanthus sonchifolius]|uniref:Uncharacterized protein n=1 Tax=Smallanthus sonchifolius TaxID=185202 RepID=A0ACB9GQW7_9ASTR|nr:hypothetical protein L1987_44588 [Smallanthus sonchifolius]
MVLVAVFGDQCTGKQACLRRRHGGRHSRFGAAVLTIVAFVAKIRNGGGSGIPTSVVAVVVLVVGIRAAAGSGRCCCDGLRTPSNGVVDKDAVDGGRVGSDIGAATEMGGGTETELTNGI